MNVYVKHFLHRGLVFGGFGPCIVGFVFAIISAAGNDLRLDGGEICIAILSSYLLAFSRAIAEVGAVSMVGGAIAWKTNVMTTAIMQYTNQGDFSKGIAIGIILISLAFIVNAIVSFLQRRLSR